MMSRSISNSRSSASNAARSIPGGAVVSAPSCVRSASTLTSAAATSSSGGSSESAATACSRLAMCVASAVHSGGIAFARHPSFNMNARNAPGSASAASSGFTAATR
jgi:hypothetical protein